MKRVAPPRRHSHAKPHMLLGLLLIIALSSIWKAFLLYAPTYTTLKNILKNGQDMVPASGSSDADIPTPYHENLRTGEWK